MRKLITGIILIVSADLSKAVVVDFRNNGQFDGDTVGDSVNVGGGITVSTRVGTTRALNTTAAGLAISGGIQGFRFDSSEVWVFDMDQDIRFNSFTFAFFGTDTPGMEDSATLGSADWIGAGFVPTAPNIMFNNATGIFTIDSTGIANSTFSMADFVGTGDMTVGANTSISLSHVPAAGGTDDRWLLEQMDVEIIPEPTSLILILICGASACWVGRFKKNRKKSEPWTF